MVAKGAKKTSGFSEAELEMLRVSRANFSIELTSEKCLPDRDAVDLCV